MESAEDIRKLGGSELKIKKEEAAQLRRSNPAVAASYGAASRWLMA